MRLSPTSYIVLGLVAQAQATTPYELKQRVEASVGNFWSIPHSQLYAEPARLAAAGYLRERQEPGGRRRKQYSITALGERALADWRDEPTAEMSELRDPGLLKLFFGGNPKELAPPRLEGHRQKLELYEALRAADTGEEPRGVWLTLDAGIAHEREWIRYWKRLANA